MVLVAIMIRNFSCSRIIAFSEVSTYLMHCFSLFILFMYVANAECAITGGSSKSKFILLMYDNFSIYENNFGRRMLLKRCMYFITYSNIYPTTQFILSGNCSTCFGWYHHPSSGAQTTVSTASGICHAVTATCRYSGR